MQSSTLFPENLVMSNCASKWMRMDDSNCKEAMNWYKTCADLADKLNGSSRSLYSSALIENIKATSDNYFSTSKKSLSTLSIIQKELSGVVERLLFPPKIVKKFKLKSEVKSDYHDSRQPQWDVDAGTIMKMIWWLSILTSFFTVVILIILFLYCIQYRKMKHRISKKDPCIDIGEFQCGPSGCECSRRIWDTGEPRKQPRASPAVDCDTSDFCESDQEIGLRFTVQSSDSTTAAHKKKSGEKRHVWNKQ